MDQELPRVHLRSALLDAGYNDSELRRQLRSGTLLPLSRGAYLTEPIDNRPDKDALRHTLLVAVERRRIADDAVVSHVSAAVIHGLPVWGVPLARVHVTRARRRGARAGPAVHVHSAPLDSEELTIAGGSVTSPARTVVDLARTCPFESAVVTGRRRCWTTLSGGPAGGRGYRRLGGQWRSPMGGPRASASRAAGWRCGGRVSPHRLRSGTCGVAASGWPGWTLPGRTSEPWPSSTDGSSTVGCFVRARNRGTSCSRKSSGRTRCERPV